ncbi:MAG: hypothetical protein U9R44_03365 [Candidatus Omnitrophota bacterium]|nr:hypothetical protein [Candidatus Omnitrophota bacterium]
MLKKIKILLLILICIGASGCAATSMKYGHMGSAVNKMHFKGLNDEQALILFHRIYNEPVQTQIDKTAKDITVTAFMIALKSRRSKLIEESLVLEKPYKKVELDKWTDDELLSFYNSLSEERMKKDTDDVNAEETMDAAGKVYWSFTNTPETEKNEEISSTADNKTTLEIIQLTAFYSVEGERKRRDNIKQTWDTVGSVVVTGLTTAAKVAMMLAGFFFLV